MTIVSHDNKRWYLKMLNFNAMILKRFEGRPGARYGASRFVVIFRNGAICRKIGKIKRVNVCNEDLPATVINQYQIWEMVWIATIIVFKRSRFCRIHIEISETLRDLKLIKAKLRILVLLLAVSKMFSKKPKIPFSIFVSDVIIIACVTKIAKCTFMSFLWRRC